MLQGNEQKNKAYSRDSDSENYNPWKDIVYPKLTTEVLL